MKDKPVANFPLLLRQSPTRSVRSHPTKYQNKLRFNANLLKSNKRLDFSPLTKSSPLPLQRFPFPLLLQRSKTGSTRESTPAIHQNEFNSSQTNTTLLLKFKSLFWSNFKKIERGLDLSPLQKSRPLSLPLQRFHHAAAAAVGEQLGQRHRQLEHPEK